MRDQWLRQIRGNNSILAVQTLRNWNMASTFLASTAILLTTGAVHLAMQQFDNSLTITLVSASDQAIKLLVLAVLFMSVFLNFSLCLRSFNHAGYLSELSAAGDGDWEIEQTLRRLVHRGAFHYSLGMRGYYYAIPLVMWFFGTHWLWLGLGGITLFLAYLDFFSA